MQERTLSKISWISVTKPNREDIEELRTRFPQIHPLIIEDLTEPTIRPRVESFDDYLYMVLHFPQFIKHEHRTISYEIDFILTPNTLITVQYEDVETLEQFWHECEQMNPDTLEEYGKTPIHLLYYLLRRFFDHSFHELDQIQQEIDMIEDRIFSGNEKAMLQDISILKRNILDFRRAVKPEHLTLQSLQLRAEEKYDNSVQPYLSDIMGEYLRVWNLLENHKETIDALYETATAALNTKTNDTVRAFTILAFLTFIPMTIAGIFGMNAEATPFIHGPNAFRDILLIMAGLTLGIYGILKSQKLM